MPAARNYSLYNLFDALECDFGFLLITINVDSALGRSIQTGDASLREHPRPQALLPWTDAGVEQ